MNLVTANGRINATYQGSEVAGPAIAGAIANVVSVPALLVIDAISYLVSAKALGTIKVSFNRTDRAQKKTSRILADIGEGIRYVLSHPVLRNISLMMMLFNLTNVTLKAEIKEFVEKRPISRDEFQDGSNYMIGFLHLFRFAEDRHFIKLGYQCDFEDSEGRNYVYLGHRVLAGVQYTLPWNRVRLSYDFAFHHRYYENKNSLYPEDDPGTRRRKDDEYSHLVRVEVPLGAGFTAGIDYQGTIQRSNLAPYTYERNIYTVSMSWTY